MARRRCARGDAVQRNRVMTKCAETGLLPPANGVMVSEEGLPELTTRNIALADAVVSSDMPTIWLLPAARPTTVDAMVTPLIEIANCPDSITLT